MVGQTHWDKVVLRLMECVLVMHVMIFPSSHSNWNLLSVCNKQNTGSRSGSFAIWAPLTPRSKTRKTQMFTLFGPRFGTPRSSTSQISRNDKNGMWLHKQFYQTTIHQLVRWCCARSCFSQALAVNWLSYFKLFIFIAQTTTLLRSYYIIRRQFTMGNRSHRLQYPPVSSKYRERIAHSSWSNSN